MLEAGALVLLGLVLLVSGGNWFVEGAAGLARLLRVRPLIIGVVIIGFGTSAPEMLISVLAVREQNGGLAVGNIVGSNIANIGLVMAVAALVFPLAVDNRVLRKELPLTVALTLLFGVLAGGDGRLGLIDGLILLTAFLAALAYILGLPRRRMNRAAAEMIVAADVIPHVTRPWPVAGLTLLGLLLILVGAQVTVDNAAILARQLGVSDAVIGLTLVAVGTSLPELVAGIVASLKRETDLIIGNVLGSNLYNLGFTGALIGIVSGDGVRLDDVLRFGSVGVMVVLTLLLVPLLLRGSQLSRIEGGLVLAAYCIYMGFLF